MPGAEGPKARGEAQGLHHGPGEQNKRRRAVRGRLHFRQIEGRIEHRFREEDRLVVARARKVERFLSQPFFVAEVFTGSPGKYVSLAETIEGFKMIISREYAATITRLDL